MSKTPSQVFTVVTSMVVSLKILFMSGKEKRKQVRNQNPLGSHSTCKQHRKHYCWWSQEKMEASGTSDVHDTLKEAGTTAQSKSESNGP